MGLSIHLVPTDKSPPLDEIVAELLSMDCMYPCENKHSPPIERCIVRDNPSTGVYFDIRVVSDESRSQRRLVANINLSRPFSFGIEASIVVEAIAREFRLKGIDKFTRTVRPLIAQEINSTWFDVNLKSIRYEMHSRDVSDVGYIYETSDNVLSAWGWNFTRYQCGSWDHVGLDNHGMYDISIIRHAIVDEDMFSTASFIMHPVDGEWVPFIVPKADFVVAGYPDQRPKLIEWNEFEKMTKLEPVEHRPPMKENKLQTFIVRTGPLSQSVLDSLPEVPFEVIDPDWIYEAESLEQAEKLGPLSLEEEAEIKSMLSDESTDGHIVLQ